MYKPVNKKVRKLTAARETSPQGWDIAITQAKAKIEELNRAIRIFEDEKRRGEPWPGEAESKKRIAA